MIDRVIKRSAESGGERGLVGLNHAKKRTVERLCFSKEPFEPTPLEIQLAELFETSLLVYLRVVGELSAFDETEDDCIFEPSQDGTDPVEGEGVPGEHIIGLHGWLSWKKRGGRGRGRICARGL